ncbi:hypothetical protein LINPERHAP1_LOCUS479 [Linum perenne]
MPFTELGCDNSWSGLEVFGFTFSRQSLSNLVRDLTITDRNGKKSYILVNRQDLCFVEVDKNGWKTYTRAYGHFSWAKYGVVNPYDQHRVRDMSNGNVLVRPLAIMPADNEDD